jgi:predicted ATPase
LTELVGREEELEILQRRWSKAKTGEGHVVLLSGEAGIGKSRLTAAVMESIASEPHTRLRYFCSPQHTDSALYPIIGQMERAAGFAHDDAPETKLNKLDAVLSQTSTSKQDAALLADMLSLPNDGRYPALDLTPEQRRQRTLQTLLSQMEALAQQNPVLMVFEDAHWSDPTSLEAFGRVIDRIAKLRILLLVTFRPEFEPPWIGRPHVTALTLNRLPKRNIDAMIDSVVGNKFLPASIRQDIIERTDGIPLFIEEMTKAVLEVESEGEARRTAAAIPSPAAAVPPSLQASLMARLDRLGAAKQVAQIGAAIGREFSHALLSAVVSKPEPNLVSALDRLIASGLLFRQGVPPHATYLFKHALIQDVAYGTLLREPRRALHARIAETLEDQFPNIAENQPELLARHCTEAGLIDKAVVFWGKAGLRSLQRSASIEAIEQLRRALAQIATLPASPPLRREEINLQVALLRPLGDTKGFAAQETRAAVEQARLLIERAEALGEPSSRLFSVLFGLWMSNLLAFNGDAVRELGAQLLALAKKQGAIVPLMAGHYTVGFSLVCTGEIKRGREYLDQGIALYNPAEHRPLATRFGQDARVVSLCFRSLTLFCLGYPDSALADAQQVLNEARAIGHAPSLMLALTYASIVHVCSANYMTANVETNELISLTNEKGSLSWNASGLLVQGCVLALTGKAADAIKMLTSGIAAYRSTGSTVHIPLGLPYLAIAHATLGKLEDAWCCLDKAMMAIETTKEKLFEAEVHRTAGEIAMMSPQPDTAKAEVFFERALAVARLQQAKSWELRAAMGMARLWRDQGKRDEARELLARVYGWFTEGFDTLDLKEAKALLDEFSS